MSSANRLDEYRWSWFYFAAALVFVPLFFGGAIAKGTPFDYWFGGIIGSAWAMHLVRPFVLRRNLKSAIAGPQS